jgi:hypothetical protein
MSPADLAALKLENFRATEVKFPIFKPFAILQK